MSGKNLLQEYFQKQKLILPVYETVKCGGSDHLPLWKSTVILCDGTSFTGKTYNSKITAEGDAAEKAYKNIVKGSNLDTVLEVTSEKVKFDSKVTLNNVSNNLSKNACLLVDLENLPNFVHELKIKNITVYGFIGKFHHMCDKPLPKDVIKIVSDSTRPNGSDSMIQLYVGYLLSLNKFDEFIIATRDKFGYSLVDAIFTFSNQSNFNITARVVNSVSQI